MESARELDRKIAETILGHAVSEESGGGLHEATPQGSRPLQCYSSSISAAWEVAEKMGIALIFIEGGSWFAMVGPNSGWRSPADFLERLGSGRFLGAGAAVSESAPLTICLAALQALENRLLAADSEPSGKNIVQ